MHGHPRFHVSLLLILALSLGLPVLAGANPLPFGKEHVDPARLPLPIGIGLTIYSQNQEYSLARLSFQAPGFEGVNTDGLAISNELDELNLKLDAWILPFLNVFGIIGQLDGSTKVGLSQLELPIQLSDLTVNYDGDVYGGGITLAYGWDRAFASLTGIYTQTSIQGDFDSSVEAFVLTPKIGLAIDRGAVWVGTMYQQADESHAGTIAIPFLGTVPFSVALEEKDAWNFLVGASAHLTDHWTLDLEGGAASRRHASLALTYRF
jgi:hypothetical protein